MKAFLQNLFSLAKDRGERGRDAETAARRFLEAKGYRFRDANVRARGGEVDLVMEKAGAVVFVEVRARQRSDFGRAAETVTPAKQSRIALAALLYAKRERLTDRTLRFDVVGVSEEGFEHIENAFVPPVGRYSI